ncbi:uncharacterized protein LOC105828556 [Monomorium pharaonis]|uniref:uncharacterized protein LOC105828556 n=1 Tax=Monomorium pharaonis TaxID=307658 RepID=UPI00063F1E8B|nr:uncharacterized protein LOC105828556 [Monomorium pharaonis]
MINPQVKLPIMYLPTFDGSYDKWFNFHDTFQALVDNNSELSKIQKFYYLCSALRDTAIDVIQSLEVSAENYATAWSLLRRQFDNRQHLISNHIQSLLDLSVLQRESGTLIRKLVDDIQKHVHALRTMKADRWDVIVVHLLNLKLDKVTQRKWRVEKRKRDDVTLDDFITFLENQATIVNTDDFNKPKLTNFSNIKRDRTSRTGRGMESAATYVGTNQTKCPGCEGFHRLYQCHKFQAMSASQRVTEVNRLKLCPICLRDHSGRECTWKGCRLCGGRHNTYLHMESAP